MDVAGAQNEPWLTPEWIPRWGYRTAAALGWIGGVAAFVIAFTGFSALGKNLELLVFLFVPLLTLVSVGLHEIGHLAAARFAGMQPAMMQVWHVAIFVRRRGCKLRWQRAPKRLGGYAIAYPDPSRSYKRSMIWMIAGGPVANLLGGCLLLGAFLMLGRTPFGFVALAVATINLTMGVANLIPAFRAHPSDGLFLLWWLRGLPEEHPRHLYLQLMGRCVFGETAEEIDPDDIAQLAVQGGAMNLVADWLQVKAAQNRMQWQQVSQREPEIESRIVAIPNGQQHALKELISFVRSEIALSKAISQRDVRCLPPASALELNRFHAPYINFRIDACRSALAGDVSATRVSLAEAERSACRSVDRALIRSEVSIRGSIAELARETADARQASADAISRTAERAAVQA